MNSDMNSTEQIAASYVDCRNFLHKVQSVSRSAGLGPRQYELLVTVSQWKSKGPTVRNIAESMRIRHNTTVELIDRATECGAIERIRDGSDRRKVYVRLTPHGEEILRTVADQVLGREVRAESEAVPEYLNGAEKVNAAGASAGA
jgi:DNA-binding MarR family transcriptional regulator